MSGAKEKTGNRISVQPEWALDLSIQQQSVLLLACRGADGIAKNHPSKVLQQQYRASVLTAALYGRQILWGEKINCTFMNLNSFCDTFIWQIAVYDFFQSVDSLPHHFYMHLMHGAEILGYKHPDSRFRENWRNFYYSCCHDLHLTPETEEQMDGRLNDFGRKEW
jgi:hypothetical protein